MAEITPDLWIGDQTACVEATHELAVVHAWHSPLPPDGGGLHGQPEPWVPAVLGA